jgi:hypothetical protein
MQHAATRVMVCRYPPFNGRLSFSKAIEELVASPRFDLWVWNISCYHPVDSTKLGAIRIISGSATCNKPNHLLIVCYSRMHKCKFLVLRGQCLVSCERMVQQVGAAPTPLISLWCGIVKSFPSTE